MSPIVHALMSWLIAITFLRGHVLQRDLSAVSPGDTRGLLRELKDRRLAILAGVLPDIDGIFILFNYDFSWSRLAT